MLQIRAVQLQDFDRNMTISQIPHGQYPSIPKFSWMSQYPSFREAISQKKNDPYPKWVQSPPSESSSRSVQTFRGPLGVPWYMGQPIEVMFIEYPEQMSEL